MHQIPCSLMVFGINLNICWAYVHLKVTHKFEIVHFDCRITLHVVAFFLYMHFILLLCTVCPRILVHTAGVRLEREKKVRMTYTRKFVYIHWTISSNNIILNVIVLYVSFGFCFFSSSDSSFCWFSFGMIFVVVDFVFSPRLIKIKVFFFGAALNCQSTWCLNVSRVLNDVNVARACSLSTPPTGKNSIQ